MAVLPKPERRGPKPRKRIARKGRPRRERATNPAKLKRHLWAILRPLIYERDKDRCFTCGAGPLEGSNRQAGHFVKAGSSLAVRYDPNNIRVQDFRCNISLSGNGAEFAVRLLTEIGEENFRTLIRRSRVKVQLRASDLREMIEAAERGMVAYETYWTEVMGPRLDALAATVAGTDEGAGCTEGLSVVAE